MSDKLEPCPFCGSKRIEMVPCRDGREVVCFDCHTSVQSHHGLSGDTSYRVAKKWNTRAALSALSGPAADARTNDILEQLRHHAMPDQNGRYLDGCHLVEEAAKEIRRLMVIVALSQTFRCPNCSALVIDEQCGPQADENAGIPGGQ